MRRSITCWSLVAGLAIIATTAYSDPNYRFVSLGPINDPALRGSRPVRITASGHILMGDGRILKNDGQVIQTGVGNVMTEVVSMNDGLEVVGNIALQHPWLGPVPTVYGVQRFHPQTGWVVVRPPSMDFSHWSIAGGISENGKILVFFRDAYSSPYGFFTYDRQGNGSYISQGGSPPNVRGHNTYNSRNVALVKVSENSPIRYGVYSNGTVAPLAFGPGNVAVGYGINEHGVSVGWSVFTPGGGANWESSNGAYWHTPSVLELVPLPFGYQSAVLTAIANDGTAYGDASTIVETTLNALYNSAQKRAFSFRPGQQPQFLDTVTSDVPIGFTMSHIMDVASGVLLGYGHNGSGQWQAFKLLPDQVEITPTSYQVTLGSEIAAGLTKLDLSDDQRLQIGAPRWINPWLPINEAIFTAHAPWSTAGDISFNIESSTSFATLNRIIQQIELYDFQEEKYELVWRGQVTRKDETLTVHVNDGEFVSAIDNAVKARVSYFSVTSIGRQKGDIAIDRVSWNLVE